MSLKTTPTTAVLATTVIHPTTGIAICSLRSLKSSACNILDLSKGMVALKP